MRPTASFVVFISIVLSCFNVSFAQGAVHETALECLVDASKVLRTIPRTLYGTNLEWFNYANNMSSPAGVIEPAWRKLFTEQGVDNIRFPGGTLSDFYHWRDGTGPVTSRPIREHPTDSGKSPNPMGTPEFLRFCEATKTQPLITVNVGTGTPEEAAAWVAYCNQANHPLRLADGLAAPANVKFWEIGNELYLPGNPEDKKIITTKPAVYAERFLAFAQAMRKVDPSIKLMAIGTANATRAALPFPDWNDVVIPRVAKHANYYAVHNSYFPMIFGQTGLGTAEVYQALLASPEAVAQSLNALSALLARHEDKNHPIEIAMTEWGALFSFDKDWIDHVKTMGTSVYLARLMQVYISNPRVTFANYFKFTDRSFMGWVGYDKKPKIPYYAFALYAKHFGTRLVAAQINSPVADIKALGPMQALSNVPDVTAIASLDDSGKKIYINLVNRSLTTIYPIKLKLNNFKATQQVTARILTSPGLTDHNGPDLPPEVPSALYKEPIKNPAAKPHIAIETIQLKLSDPIYLAPHTILTLELEAQKN